MSNVKQADDELNRLIISGQAYPAGFDKFYADEVVMTEGGGESYQGKEVNRKREEEFFSSVQEFHSVKLVASAVDGDVSFSEWEWELTFKNGARVGMQQVARRRWKNGQIVNERFYYNAPK